MSCQRTVQRICSRLNERNFLTTPVDVSELAYSHSTRCRDRDKGCGRESCFLATAGGDLLGQTEAAPCVGHPDSGQGQGTVSETVQDRLSQSTRLSQSVYEIVSVSLRDRLSQSTRPSQSVYETVSVSLRDRISQSTRLSQSVYETVSVSLRDRLSQSTRPSQSVYETVLVSLRDRLSQSTRPS